jgi:hypothetical protein
MNGYHLVSSKKLIAELFSDYNIDNTDWVGKAQRHIARGLGIMKVDGYYEIGLSFKTIREYQAPLPCDSKYILAVLIYDNGRITRLPLTRSWSLGVVFKDLQVHNIYKGTINFNWLKTNIEEANIIYVYHRIPKDDNGDLLIPDQDDVLDVLPYFVIAKLSLSGYKHPVISREEAEAKWELMYPRARNRANYPSIEERDRMMKMNTNPLFVNIINEDWLPGNISDEGVLIQSLIDYGTAVNWNSEEW